MLTSVYYVIIEVFSQPDQLATLLGYIGIWLEGALFIAIGLLGWLSVKLVSRR